MTTALFQAYLDIDKALAVHGVHRTSRVWLAEIERFYKHASAKVMVECMGRGSSKSTNSCKMAIAEIIGQAWDIPPGEIHYFAHIAENVQEAAKTLRILESYLRFLKIAFTRSADTLTLVNLPLGFKVLACRVGAVSGFRCCGWTLDEASKWVSDGAEPGEEVLASVRAMTVTHPNARGRVISSPLGTKGFFFDIWIRGNTSDQVAGQFATWLANESVTEDQTRRLEPNEDKWKREYAAIPIEGDVQSLYSAEMLRRCTRPHSAKSRRVERKTPHVDNYAISHPWVIPPEVGCQYYAAQDPALSRNTYTMVVACKRVCADSRVRRSIVFAKEWTGRRDRPLDPFAVLKEIAVILAEYELSALDTDEHHGASLRAIAAQDEIGLYLNVVPSTARGNLEKYENLYTLISNDEIELPDYRDLRDDMLGVRRLVTANGLSIRLDEIGSRHSDYAPAASQALIRSLVDPEAQGPAIGSPAFYAAEEKRAEAALIAKLETKQREERSGDWMSSEARAAGFNI